MFFITRSVCSETRVAKSFATDWISEIKFICQIIGNVVILASRWWYRVLAAMVLVSAAMVLGAGSNRLGF